MTLFIQNESLLINLELSHIELSHIHWATMIIIMNKLIHVYIWRWLAAWWIKGKLFATQALSQTQKNVSESQTGIKPAIFWSPVRPSLFYQYCFLLFQQPWTTVVASSMLNNIVETKQHCLFNNIVHSTTLFFQQCSFNIVHSTTLFVQQHCLLNNIVHSTTLFIQQHCL